MEPNKNSCRDPTCITYNRITNKSAKAARNENRNIHFVMKVKPIAMNGIHSMHIKDLMQKKYMKCCLSYIPCIDISTVQAKSLLL